ncbi:MAG TPA: phosphatase PAP2 family protein [Longimicrobiales bacterium]|nr:phosphatase PAP2 family protein [Longimicrobiales bacterium]
MSIRVPAPAAVVLAAALLSACDTAPTEPTLASPSSVALHAPPVTLEWQQQARTLVAQRSMSPLAAARMFAGASLAAMRAVETVDASTPAPAASRANGYGPGGRSRYEARRGAVAGASARVLAWFVPTSATDLEALVVSQGEAGPGDMHPDFTRGVEIGRAAADAVIAHLMSDGFTAPWTGSVPVGPGLWTTSVLPPAGAMLGQVTPWFMTSGSQFRPAPPPAYLSPAFNADLAQVSAIAAGLTPQQRAIALAWAYGGGTYTPVGYWNELASTYVAADGLDEAEAAKVFGVMSASVFDALIAAFEAKYYYWTLRPHQANPAIVPVFPVPNYPAYPSGHGSVSGASARVLAHFFPQRATELNALRDDAAMSRIYAGIHFFFDMTAARTMSEQIADMVIESAQ